MGNGEIANGQATMTLQKALDIAREAESGVDPNTAAFLQRELDGVWSKLRAQPDSYIFTRDEYSLFNYYHQQQTGNELATKAIQRFWNHYRLADPASRG
ncbi:putative peptide-n4-(n-acetyl-beta-glucosaminyl)asparagine amidase a [Diplodia seriata]|nr:putative peptide-n4-(n-acetyl-beta-glucosaminyl)asparagine amidase a [Diplodia seriata]